MIQNPQVEVVFSKIAQWQLAGLQTQILTTETFAKAKVIPGIVNKHLEPLAVVFSDTCYGMLLWVHLSLVYKIDYSVWKHWSNTCNLS